MLTQLKIREAIWHACVANDVASLADRITPLFSKRLKTSYGSANYSTKRIFLCKDLFEKSTAIKQYECVIHLVCHMVVRYKWLRSETYTTFPKLHGKEWRSAMAATSVPMTTAYCNTPPSEKLVKVDFQCNCNNDLQFNAELAKKIIESDFFCKTCNIKIQPKEISDAEHIDFAAIANSNATGTACGSEERQA